MNVEQIPPAYWRAMRAAADLSQGKLAKEAGIATTLVHDIETGDRKVSTTSKQWVLVALGRHGVTIHDPRAPDAPDFLSSGMIIRVKDPTHDRTPQVRHPEHPGSAVS